MTVRAAALLLMSILPANQASQPASSPHTISIRLIDSRTGSPIATDDVEVWTDEHNPRITKGQSGSDGIAIFNLPPDVSRISLFVQQHGWGLAHCDYRKGADVASLFYSVDAIAEKGISAPNYCNHRTAPVHQGELILFFRPQSLWEKMKS